MKESGPLSQILWLICLVSCALLGCEPALADTANPPASRMYTPARPAIATVPVPDLRQRSLSEAQKIATDARLRLKVSGDGTGNVVVVDQNPAPNTQVPTGTTVTVSVRASAVQETRPLDPRLSERRGTVVPDVVKRSLAEAQPLVTNARLKLEVSGGSPEDTSHAIVIDQKPAAGTRVAVGATVVVGVQVQRTEDWVVVPELRPRSLPVAQRLANAARLKLDVSGGWPEDTSRASVVEQKPPPGTRVRAGSTVVVTVRTQQTEELTAVPELRNQLLLDAQQRVARARLRLEVAGGWPANPLLATVVDQKPLAETRVPINSAVVVYVRVVQPPQPLPPPPQVVTPVDPTPPQTNPPPRDEWTTVPTLRQRPLMDALQRVKNARLRLEVMGGWPSGPERAVVFEQQPAPDTRVRLGSTVVVQITPPVQAQEPPAPPAVQPPVVQPPVVQPPVAQPPPVRPPPPAPPVASPQPPPPPPRAELVMVPDLRQHALPEARELATGATLELRVRGESPANETLAVVVSQRPAAGARVAARSVILVELGPAMIAVPDLRKHPLNEARQMLSQAGFELAIMGEPPSNESRAQVVEQAPQPGVRAAAGSTVTVRAKVSQLTTWVVAGAGALLAAAGAAFGVARWRGVRSHPAGLPGIRVVANSDVGIQEMHANGTAAAGFAIRLRSRIDPGSQTLDANGRLVSDERRVDG